jgi:hypothetical protein
MSERHTSRKPLKASEPEMRPEYDFSRAIRGKYHKRYVETTNVVVIAPDVHAKFRNTAAVNEALRKLLRTPSTKRGLTKRIWTPPAKQERRRR